MRFVRREDGGCVRKEQGGRVEIDKKKYTPSRIDRPTSRLKNIRTATSHYK